MQASNHKNQNTNIQQRGGGIGVPSEQAVEERAQELARIDGRGPASATEEDRKRAWQELHGTGGTLSTDDAHSDLVASRNPADVAVETGHAVPTQTPSDEQQIMEQEIEEGLQEAEHERMLQGQNKAKTE